MRRDQVYVLEDALHDHRLDIALLSFRRGEPLRPEEIGDCSVLFGVVFPFVGVHARESSIRLRIEVYKQCSLPYSTAVSCKIDGDGGLSDTPLQINASDNSWTHDLPLTRTTQMTNLAIYNDEGER